MSARKLACLGLSLTLGGCASAKATGPRGEMNDLVADRLGVDDAVTAEQDQAALRKLRDRVEAILAEPITPESALELALLNNHALAATMEDLGVAQAELADASFIDNPTVGGDIIISTLGFGIGGGFSATTSLLSAFLIPAKKKLAKARLKQTILQVGRSAAELAEAVKIAYVHAQLAAIDQQLHLEVWQAAEFLDEMAQRQREAGNITERERRAAAAELDEARLEFGHARMEAMMAREELHVLFGLWGDDLDYELPKQIAEVPAEAPELQGLMTRALEQRLDLSAARFDVEAAMRAIKLRRAGVIPGIEAGVEGGNEVGDDVGHEWVIGPTLSIELPIFNPGHADFAMLRAMLRAAEHRLAQLAVQVRSDVRLHRQHLAHARQEAAYIRDTVVPRREAMLQLTLERYNAMLIGAEELFEAKRDLIDARRQLAEARADYWVAAAELELAIGGRLAKAAPAG